MTLDAVAIRESLSRKVPRTWVEHMKGWLPVSIPPITSPGALPDFIIIGAQKGGTSSLYRWLLQHPQVCSRTTKKEIQYFTNYYQRGETWYRHHFPVAGRLMHASAVCGEATPYYLFHPYAAERIAATVPQAKLIALLREPVGRAISHYFHEYRLGHETLQLEEAFAAESARMNAALKRIARSPFSRDSVLQHNSYATRGLYAEQLRRYRHFYENGQLLLIDSKDLFDKPDVVLRRVLVFLGIDASLIPADLKARNIGHYSSRVPDSVVQHLHSCFEASNLELRDEFGFSFSE